MSSVLPDVRLACTTKGSPEVRTGPVTSPTRPATRRTVRVSCGNSGISCAVTCLRSEEHTSELQSRSDLVCRLLLEKKKTYQACTSSAEAPSFMAHIESETLKYKPALSKC